MPVLAADDTTGGAHAMKVAEIRAVDDPALRDLLLRAKRAKFHVDRATPREGHVDRFYLLHEATHRAAVIRWGPGYRQHQASAIRDLDDRWTHSIPGMIDCAGLATFLDLDDKETP